MIDLSTVVTDLDMLTFRCLYREGFAFTSLPLFGNTANIFDAIIVRNPTDASCFTPKFGKSMRSLDEHIDFINKHQLEKAVVIAENIDFLSNCPSIKHVNIIPADNVDDFDFSPLTKMYNLVSLKCTTEYGVHMLKRASIDYSHLLNLSHLEVEGSGNINYQLLPAVKQLYVSKASAHDLTGIFSSKSLELLSLTQCKVKSLNGIEQTEVLTELTLWHNRSLSDISSIVHCADSLKSLSIDACPKITDFSFLHKLHNLEFLELYGSNTLDDLSFLTEMKNLKMFIFDMNVLNGDLSYCLSLPYVRSCRNRKHYNLSDNDLPKNHKSKDCSLS